MHKPIKCMIANRLGTIKINYKADMCLKEVPREVQEKFIYSGYRHVESGFLATVASLWRSHNETINIWSHMLALLYFIYYFYDARLQAVISLIPEEHQLPLYIYFLGVCILFFASSGAHLLNCISLTWRNVCFMIDYSAISVYGSFAAIYYYYYHNSRIIDVIRTNGSLFLVAVLLTAVFATWASCHTRLRHTPLCHHIRTSVYVMPFLLGNFPVLIRFVSHVYNNYNTFLTLQSFNNLISYSDPGWYWPKDNATNSSPTLAQAESHSITEDEFFRGYIRHLTYLFAAAIVNVIKVPERWYPGCFDIVAHSHQWFHVLIFLGIREQFWLIIHDLYAQYSNPLNHEGLLQGTPSLFWVAILYKVLIITLAIILTWYARAIHAKEKAKLA